jgi:hypothetical protein
MAKKVIEKDEPETRWEQIFEYEDCITIWKYVKKGMKQYVYEVEIKQKKPTRN